MRIMAPTFTLDGPIEGNVAAFASPSPLLVFSDEKCHALHMCRVLVTIPNSRKPIQSSEPVFVLQYERQKDILTVNGGGSFMSEPKITKTHRWPPRLISKVELLARIQNRPVQHLLDDFVLAGLVAAVNKATRPLMEVLDELEEHGFHSVRVRGEDEDLVDYYNSWYATLNTEHLGREPEVLVDASWSGPDAVRILLVGRDGLPDTSEELCIVWR